jgi:hypothetical protein
VYFTFRLTCITLQAESYNVPSSLQGIADWRERLLDSGFATSKYGSIAITSYATGHIGFLVNEKSEESSMNFSGIKQRYNGMVAAGKKTTYYHPPLQRSSFDLPLWAQESIYGDSPPPSFCEDNDARPFRISSN